MRTDKVTTITTGTTITRLALILAVWAGAGACKQPGKYAGDKDTGAAAPATKIDMSETKRAGDSTTGIATPVAGGTAAGDSAGRRRPTDNPGMGTKQKRP